MIPMTTELRATVCRGRNVTGRRCMDPTTSASGFCPLHETRPGFAGRFRRMPSHPIYRTAAWRRLRKRVVGDWVASHGWVCPGWRRRRHPSRQLAADHVVPLVLGGAPLDRANVSVLCASCNARKGLSERRR